MPIPTPFHPRTFKLCTSLKWKDWAGYYSVASFDTSHESEYFAFRHAAGLMDFTPLFKYEVYGPDAAEFLSYVLTKDIRRLQPGNVAYCCWCDDFGKVIDDGTVVRLEEDYFRVTAAEPMYSWFTRHQQGFENVHIEDSTRKYAVLAIQGPTSRDILKQSSDVNLDSLEYFRIARGKLDGVDVVISRTGYTGDLGYEVWVENHHALSVWDALVSLGKPYGIEPAGLDALDVARVEAGFIMNDVDYFSAHHCLIESRKSTPYELGLGWTVDIEREPFVGQRALQAELRDGPKLALVGLEYAWEEYEELCARHALPAQAPSHAWRTPVPLYDGSGRHIGRATSGSWSPILKKALALGTVDSRYKELGTRIKIEATVEYQRHKVTATVVPRPFYNPERKKS